jgi:hypothetical protein
VAVVAERDAAADRAARRTRLTEIGIDGPPIGGYKEIQPGAFREAVRLLAANALPTPSHNHDAPRA